MLMFSNICRCSVIQDISPWQIKWAHFRLYNTGFGSPGEDREYTHHRSYSIPYVVLLHNNYPILRML
jgi:hypothetical protein